MFRTILASFPLLILASLPLLSLEQGASAQSQSRPVQILEEPPPLEVLRHIMGPESRPGRSRRIILTNPDLPASVGNPAAYDAEPIPGPNGTPPRRQSPSAPPVPAPQI